MASTLRLDEIAPHRAPDFAELGRAVADLDAPFGVIDLGGLRRNALDLVRRASGTPIRLATKSVRCRAITDAVLALPGFSGVLTLTLAEALWLATPSDAGPGVTDAVVGYPSVDRAALRQLAASSVLAERVTLMIDSSEHLDLVERLLPDSGPPLRVCLDLDASLRLGGGRVHVGVRRSPVHSVDDAVALARAVLRRPRFRLVGVMSYEAQIAGVGDDPGRALRAGAVRAVQAVSGRELVTRRAAAVAAVREVAPLEFVNGGGTGSLEATSSEPAVTEVAAGSGLYGPALFDTYRRFTPVPAAFFALPVVRRPSATIATVAGGGWVASGTPGFDRLPTPVWPTGLRLTATEGAGEAQTPLFGPGARDLRLGDLVWFRHTKAGELSEHVDDLHLVDAGRVAAVAPTYRGEGRAFL